MQVPVTMAMGFKGVARGIPLRSFVAKQQEVINWIKISEALLYVPQDMPR